MIGLLAATSHVLRSRNIRDTPLNTKALFERTFRIVCYYADPSQFGNPLTFNGKRNDPETGFYYYRTRFLDGVAARFSTRDPVGVNCDQCALGNGYTFAGNSPTTFVDPFGLAAKVFVVSFIDDWVTYYAYLAQRTFKGRRNDENMIPIKSRIFNSAKGGPLEIGAELAAMDWWANSASYARLSPGGVAG